MKRLIQKRFDLASQTYDSVAQVQKTCAGLLTANLRRQLPEFRPKSVLDIGTGTGYVPALLQAVYPDATYHLNDISANMLAVCREKFTTNTQFLLGDFEVMPIEACDLIISNLALQWATQLKSSIQRFYHQSRVFSFTCLLEGTFHEWYEMLRAVGCHVPDRAYLSSEKFTELLRRLDGQCQVETRKFVVRFDSAYLFMKYLKRLGAASGRVSVSPQMMRVLMESGPLSVTYHVLFALMTRV